MTGATAVSGVGVRRRRGHTGYRPVEPRVRPLGPGTPARRPGTVVGDHRERVVQVRCSDERVAARRAALRRRHFLLGTVAIALLLALASPWGGRTSHDSAGAVSVGARAALAPHTVYVVQAGDTLWSIAERLDPRGDPRPVMAQLSAQTGGDTARQGQRLVLP